MRILVTGVDRPLGALLCRGLSSRNRVIGQGMGSSPPSDLGLSDYSSVDLRDIDAVTQLTGLCDRVVHTVPFDPIGEKVTISEGELLDWVARGTYVLLNAASGAGVGSLVLISRMELLADHPKDLVVGEDWAPIPRPQAVSLAPYLAELTCREIARTGRIDVVCLRFGDIDGQNGTSPEAAMAAVAEAVAAEIAPQGGHSWTIRHVLSGSIGSR